MSWWVKFRDKALAFFGHEIEVATPLLEQAGTTALGAIIAANANGTHDAHGLAMAAVGSLKDQAPALGAKLTLAVAADAMHQAGPQIAPPPLPANDTASQK